MKVLAIYDFGDITADRYTVVYDEIAQWGIFNGKLVPQHYMVGMGAYPYHPQGIGQHGECPNGPHLGKEITFDDLPEDCQRVVMDDLNCANEEV